MIDPTPTPHVPMTISRVATLPSWITDYLYPAARDGKADFYGTQTASAWFDITDVDREAEPVLKRMQRVYLVFRHSGDITT